MYLLETLKNEPIFCLGLLDHCGLGVAYTMLGGSRAVIWTDVAQFVVFIFAFIVIGGLLLAYFDWQPMRIYDIASLNGGDQS